MGATFSPTQLAEALRLAESANSAHEAARLLRQHFATLRIVVVDAFDMRSEVPAAQGAQRRLYLSTSDGHCWSVTNDPSQVAGLILA
ncbi:MAG TPA: hypothetical protein VK195_12235 [Burkholderiaceae bacterium]|nr:hypothetical protein [Burkholderiaceae bacterium]